jgi:hypothetical protein
MKYLLLVLVLSLSFYGCSVQQRQYRSGFYHDRNRTHLNLTSTPVAGYPLQEDRLGHALVSEETADKKALDRKIPAFAQRKGEILNAPLSKGCDTLLMFNGEKIVGLIQTITPESIVYIPCNAPEGPGVILIKRKVNKIIYANGSTVLVRNSESTKFSASPNDLDQKYVPSFNYLAKSDLEKSRTDQDDRTEQGTRVLVVILYILVICGLIVLLAYLSNL